jgi:hypothetical protein
VLGATVRAAGARSEATAPSSHPANRAAGTNHLRRDDEDEVPVVARSGRTLAWRSLVVAVVLLSVLGACSGSDAAEGRVEPTSWWLAAEPAGRTVEVAVLVGPERCERFEDVLVSEHANRVRLQARVRVVETGAACREELRFVRERVQLDQPLGGRTLTGCATRDDRLYPAPRSCVHVEAPGPAPRVGDLRPSD